MKTTTIKKGYRLTVVSWENDGDNYNTKMMEGLKKEEVQFLVELISMFSGRSQPDFGNEYEASPEVRKSFREAMEPLVAKHDISKFRFKNQLEIDDDYMDGVHDLLYSLMGGGEFWHRVMESYKVEFMPKAVKLQDVTDEFKS